MRRRREAPPAAGDHLLLRLEPLRLRHRRQAAHQTPGRLAGAAPVPLARPLGAAAPEAERVAIEPARRDVRGVDLRPSLLERAPLEEVSLGRRFVAPR